MTAKKTILCVDDEHSLSIHKVTLETRGYRVLTCATAAEAMSILANRRVDLVLSGMTLPDLQAPELAQRVKSHCAEMPVVLLSCGKRIVAVDASADLLLRKDCAPAELLQRIRLLMSKRRGSKRNTPCAGAHNGDDNKAS